MESLVKDDVFDHIQTKTLLRGTEPRKFEKDSVIKVLKYFAKNNEKLPISQLILKYTQSNNNEENYNNLINSINDCDSMECLLMNAIKFYHIKPRSLLMLTTAICSRVMPFNNKTEWFDNFTLNSYLYQLTTIVNKKFDNQDVFSIDFNFKLNPNISLIHPRKMLEYYGNEFRVFQEFGKETKDIKDEELTETMDKLMEKYYYSTGGAHGCDCFRIPIGGSIEEINKLCLRYPNNIFGYILNTATYESGQGQHWVMLIFKNRTVYFICSFGKNISILMDSHYITSELYKYGFSIEYNMTPLQQDNYNCGLYSTLATLCFILESSKCDRVNIQNVVSKIGKNGLNISDQGINRIREILVGSD